MIKGPAFSKPYHLEVFVISIEIVLGTEEVVKRKPLIRAELCALARQTSLSTKSLEASLPALRHRHVDGANHVEISSDTVCMAMWGCQSNQHSVPLACQLHTYAPSQEKVTAHCPVSRCVITTHARRNHGRNCLQLPRSNRTQGQ